MCRCDTTEVSLSVAAGSVVVTVELPRKSAKLLTEDLKEGSGFFGKTCAYICVQTWV